MAVYQVSTQDKKCVEEREIWNKDDKVIVRITGFRWGTVRLTTEDDEELEIDADNPEGINVYDCGYDCELDSLDDGWLSDTEWPEDMSDDERERLQTLWEEDDYSAWESEGWHNSETECWFHGSLEIVKED